MKAVKLGDICELITRGISPKYTEDEKLGVTVLNQKCIRNKAVLYEFGRLHSLSVKSVNESKFVKSGDVLVNSTGHGTLGRTALAENVDKPLLVDSHVTILRPVEGLFEPRYFAYLIGQSENDFIDMATGTSGQTELPRALLNEYKVSYEPSLEEQRRIVARLDAAFEKISAAEVLTQQNLDNVSALQKSILHQQLKVSDNTRNYSLADAGFIQTGTTPKTSIRSYYGGDIAFIKPSDFHDDGSLNMNGQKLSASGLSVGRLIDKNSVLMVCIGATIGKVGYTDTSLSCNQQINAITLNSFEEAKYLYYIMTTDSFQENVKSGSNQMTLPIINKTSWGNLTVDLPDLNTQKEIVAKLDDTLGKTRKLESQYQKKLAKLVDLRQSLLAEAFSTTNTV